MMNQIALKVTDLSYTYPSTLEPSLQNLTLEIPQHSCTVILGPNGAGKSTLMSLMCGLMKTTATELSFPAFQDSTSFISYGTQNCALYQELSLYENLNFFAQLMETPGDQDLQIQELATALDLKSYLHKRVAHCSGGIRQRAHVAIALLNCRPLIVLDEPFNNIDPESRELIRDILKKYLNEKKTTLVLSSHQFEAMEDLWTHLVFLKKGKVSHFLERDSAVASQTLQKIFFELR